MRNITKVPFRIDEIVVWTDRKKVVNKKLGFNFMTDDMRIQRIQNIAQMTIGDELIDAEFVSCTNKLKRIMKIPSPKRTS